MPSEYETKLQEWKERYGIGHMRDTNQDELLMAAEESQAKGKSWCFGCDKHMLIREMKLITKTLDPYTQCDEGEGDYIAKENRVRMCPECFEEHYGPNAKLRDAGESGVEQH